jgi:opacity protein-like surface antigen
MGHISIGASLPQSNAGDFLDDGWALHGGATWFSPKRPSLGLRLDFGVDWWDVKNSVLKTIDTDPTTPITIEPPDDGDARAWSGSVDLMWNPESKGTVGFYLMGGVGVYYTSVDITEEGIVPGYWCDWWWGICYPTLVQGEYLIQSSDSWELGLNAGVGITFQTSSGQIYLEAVYHWVDTENTAQFVPIQIGYRW